MRKEYIVVRIDAAPDGSPYIFVSLVEPKDMKEKPQSPFGVQVVSNFTSLEDLMKNINRMITSQMVGGFTTTIKLSMKEYEESGIRVGDKIYVDIIKPDVFSNEIVLGSEQIQKYEKVINMLTENGIRMSEWSIKRDKIILMINKGMNPEDIAREIIDELKGN